MAIHFYRTQVVCNFTYGSHSHLQDSLNRRTANTLFVLSDSLWVTAEQISQVDGKILIAADRWRVVFCRDRGLAMAGQPAVQ